MVFDQLAVFSAGQDFGLLVLAADVSLEVVVFIDLYVLQCPRERSDLITRVYFIVELEDLLLPVRDQLVEVCFELQLRGFLFVDLLCSFLPQQVLDLLLSLDAVLFFVDGDLLSRLSTLVLICS